MRGESISFRWSGNLWELQFRERRRNPEILQTRHQRDKPFSALRQVDYGNAAKVVDQVATEHMLCLPRTSTTLTHLCPLVCIVSQDQYFSTYCVDREHRTHAKRMVLAVSDWWVVLYVLSQEIAHRVRLKPEYHF